MKRTEPFVVCSTTKVGVAPGISALRAASFNDWLTRANYNHGACVGMWQNEREMAEIVLTTEGSPEFDRLLSYAFGPLAQACVMVVGGDSTATLHWSDGHTSHAGTWRCMGGARPTGDYTYRAGVYYVTAGDPHV